MDVDPLTQFIDQASRIEKSGRWKALNEKIIQLAGNPGANEPWLIELLAALCFQVCSQYRLLRNAHDIENATASLLAWRARNLLELYVWCQFFKSSRSNARMLYEDAGRDAIDLFDSFHEWGRSAGMPASWHERIENSKIELIARAQNVGINDLNKPYIRVAVAADKCGIRASFEKMNKLLSKFAHPTAMQILGFADPEKLALQRATFYGIGCGSFLDAFTVLEQSVVSGQNC